MTSSISLSAHKEADDAPARSPTSNRASHSAWQPENQLQELQRYTAARGWTTTEFVDRGVSGSKDKRPALDALLRDAKPRRFDVLVCWRLDRLGRNLRHLVTLMEELQGVGVAFVSLGSDQCVVVEGPYRSGRGGHFGTFDGEIHATMSGISRIDHLGRCPHLRLHPHARRAEDFGVFIVPFPTADPIA
jgi:hypothetical protein